MDSLSRITERFAGQTIENSILINSVPKCGTMLLRNILYAFVRKEQAVRRFVANETLSAMVESDRARLYTGHLCYSPEAVATTQSFRRLVLVRDPYDYVLSYTRFMFSDHPSKRDVPIRRYIREKGLTFDDVVPLMICGVRFGGNVFPSVKDSFTRGALSWLNNATLVRYEDILNSLRDVEQDDSRRYFENLLGACGLELPADWRDRVRFGADRDHSGTVPRWHVPGDRSYLTDSEKALVELTAPGLRDALGYGTRVTNPLVAASTH